MACDAFTLNAECRGAIVTATAGFALFHISHGCPVHALLGFKTAGVTFVTGKQFYVDRVWISYLSYLFILVNNVFGNMTSDTILCDAESV